MSWEGEVCKKCKYDQRLAWCIEDDKWTAVVSTKYRNRVLCLECFLALADKKGIEIKVNDFLFFGWVGMNVKGDTLIDRNRTKEKQMKISMKLKSFKPQKDDTIIVKTYNQLEDIKYKKLANEIRKEFPNNLVIILPSDIDIGALPEKDMNKLGWFKKEK